MSDFIVEKLTKSVGDKTVFKEISFIIHDLDRIGIIGVNGTGKTTLLDVVSERIGFDGDVSNQNVKKIFWPIKKGIFGSIGFASEKMFNEVVNGDNRSAKIK